MRKRIKDRHQVDAAMIHDALEFRCGNDGIVRGQKRQATDVDGDEPSE